MKRHWEKLTSGQIDEVGCDTCSGSGYIKIPKKPLGFSYQYCSCLVEHESLKETVHLWKKAGISNRLMKRYAIRDWEQTNSLTLDVLIRVIDDEKKWLFIHGPTGSGKTYTSILAAKVALLRERSVSFVTVPELMDYLRPSNGAESHRDEMLKHCKTDDLLILDDIGQEKASDWVREQLFIILNSRWNNQKQTIFTSNYPLDNIRRTIGPAVHSRILGESLVITLLTDKDKRIK